LVNHRTRYQDIDLVLERIAELAMPSP